MPTLTYLNTDAAGESLLIQVDRFSVGRDPLSSLCLDNLSVSANHAEIRCEKNIWSLRDVGSSNGTHHNGSKTYLAIIKHGDQIGFGDVLFRFDLPPAIGIGIVPIDGDKNQTRLVELPDFDSALIDAGDSEVDAVEWTQERRALLHRAMKPYLIGDSSHVDLMLMSLLSRGHAIMSGPCGLSRLRLSSAFAQLLDLDLRQLQSERDLEQHGHFLFARGINDLPQETRAKLFSMMRNESDAATDSDPFMVVATRETHDPLCLSTAQLNMFLTDIRLSYPTREQEENLLAGLMEEEPLVPLILRSQMIQLQQVVSDMAVGHDILHKAVDLLRATRPCEREVPAFVQEHVITGAGPSAGRMLLHASKAWAFLHGRIDVTLQDVRHMMIPVLGHRLVMRGGGPADDILSKLADQFSLPE